MVSLSLHAGHFTPAFILYIPVSFFSPEQQQVLEESPIHKDKNHILHVSC